MKEYIVRVHRDRTEWFNKDGDRHRIGGPAVEWTDGSKEWWLNGKWHREDGPAIEYANGYKEYYINGKMHREDGPAIENADGRKEWYIKGERYTEAEYHNLMAPVKELTVAEVEQLLGYKVKIKA